MCLMNFSQYIRIFIIKATRNAYWKTKSTWGDFSKRSVSFIKSTFRKADVKVEEILSCCLWCSVFYDQRRRDCLLACWTGAHWHAGDTWHIHGCHRRRGCGWWCSFWCRKSFCQLLPVLAWYDRGASPSGSHGHAGGRLGGGDVSV